MLQTFFTTAEWCELEAFGLPRTMDIFNDGSLHIVDAPGHLPGHINLLARTYADNCAPGSLDDREIHYVYLAGDTCHDRRILNGEKEISEWRDAEGHACCIHTDRAQAEKSIEMVRRLEAKGVEVIFAHDVEWEQRIDNETRFWGAGVSEWSADEQVEDPSSERSGTT